MLPLKQKIRHILRQKTKSLAWLAALAVFCLGFGTFFIGSKQALAASYTPDKIQIKVDMQVNGKNNNFARVGKDGQLKIQVNLTLVSPSQLVIGQDSLDLNEWKLQNRLIDGFGVGLKSKTDSQTYYCAQTNVTNGVGTSNFLGCTFALTDNNLSSRTIQQGQTIYSGTFTVSGSNLDNLGITSTTGVNEFYIYPYLVFDNATSASVGTTALNALFLGAPNLISALVNGVTVNLVYSPGKSFYVQLYNTDAEAKAADAANAPVPTGVPGYGSVTATGNAAPGGSPLLGLINDLINIIAALIKQFIYWIFYLLVAPLIQGMLSIRTYTDAFAAVIYPGWEVVRNVCNILFVVALIAIGLGTLFRIESYQYKHLLVDLIIAALLVNFSLVIAQAILGVADTVQSQFLPNNVDVIRGLARDLMAGGWDKITITNLSDAGFFANSIQPLFSLGLALASFVVFAAIAGFLFVRIVMLWVLLMLSPLAYAMRVLPQTKSYAGKWWGEFIKYAFFTPVMAFFLNMAAVINNSYKNNPIFTQVSNDPTLIGASADSSGVATFAFRVGGNFIILIFLVVAIKVAEQAGVYGADIVAKTAQKGLFAPFKPSEWGKVPGAGYLGRKYSDWTVNKVRGHEPKVSVGRSIAFSILNPKAAVKGWQKRSEELKHESQAKAEAAGLEIVEQRLTGGKKVFQRVQAVERHAEDQFAKEYSFLGREAVVKTAVQVLGMKDNDEGKAAKRGIIKVAMEKGYIDDVLVDGADVDTAEGKAFIEKLKNYGIVDPNAKNWKKDWYIDESGKKRIKYDTRQRRAMYKAFFAEGHHDIHDQAALRLLTEDAEEAGKKTSHFEYLKDGVFDIEKGLYRLRKDTEYKYDSEGNLQYDENGDPELLLDTEEQKLAHQDDLGGVNFAAGEVAKMGDRAQAGVAYHSLISLAKQGKIVDQVFLKKIARAIMGNPGFMQQRTSPNLIFGQGAMTTEQQQHFSATNRVLIDEETLKGIRQIANAEPGVVAATYQLGVFNKIDKGDIEKIVNKGYLEFDVKDQGGNVATKRVQFKFTEQQIKEMQAAAEKLAKEEAKKVLDETEQKSAKEQEKAFRQAIIDLANQMKSNPSGRGGKRKGKI